uniref:Zinc binding alcohol dehydrogenase domain containing 2 n=1 Tax=Nephromyces sp. MMRI TaxID=2496275 RepID=A0A3S8V367_9APIC|nr:zinc binding alcohol dehydrogenase domain containing 2 [Nephromyces sp. MMRI]
MRSVLTRAAGGIGQLFVGTSPRPVIQENEVLIRTCAAGLNRLDIMQREGKYPVPAGASTIMGVEVSGIIEESKYPHFKAGDRVMSLLSGGGYAEYVSCRGELCLPIPSNLSFHQAASIPEAWLTAYQLLNLIGDFKNGESVLIHAAGSGVGLALIQLCKCWGAKHIIATSRSESKLITCKEYGATNVVNTKDYPEFSSEVLTATDGRGVDLVLDCVGGNYLDENVKSCVFEARYVLYAIMAGAKANINLARVVQKQVKLITTRLRSRPLQYRSDLVSKFSELLPYFEDGSFKLLIDSVYGMDDVQEAHKRMESNENTGKIILEISKE